MRAVVFHPQAEEELLYAAEFYENQTVGLGADFLTEVERAVERAIAAPDSGSPIKSDIRRQLVRRFPFSVLYRSEGERVLVLAVMHQRRRPGYWRDRA